MIFPLTDRTIAYLFMYNMDKACVYVLLPTYAICWQEAFKMPSTIHSPNNEITEPYRIVLNREYHGFNLTFSRFMFEQD